MRILRPFTQHPASVGESYGEHFVAACTFSIKMITGGLACLAHALFPFLFVHTGSNCVTQLHGKMLARRTGAIPGNVPGLRRAP
jgi:hypothetical protein